MVFHSIRIASAILFASATGASAMAQFHSPSCAVPSEPTCAVPPVPCDATCAAPAGCSSCDHQSGTCYQSQHVNCAPQSRGLFGCGLRPLFNWTKIEVENKERCCKTQSQCCQPQMATVPTMAYQPVQLQMTAYQPVMMQAMAPAAVFQPAAVPATFVPQAIQPMTMMAAPQQFVQPVSMVSAPQQYVQTVAVAPQQLAAVRPASTPACNLEQVCKDLDDLKARVSELSRKIETSSGSSVSVAVDERLSKTEQAIEKLNEASNLQTEVLKEMKKQLDAKK